MLKGELVTGDVLLSRSSDEVTLGTLPACRQRVEKLVLGTSLTSEYLEHHHPCQLGMHHIGIVPPAECGQANPAETDMGALSPCSNSRPRRAQQS